MLYLCACSTTKGNDSYAAYRLLAMSFRRLTGAQMPEVVFRSAGKPYWKNSIWHFGISHTANAAFCAISDATVGLDAEPLTRPIREPVVEKVLSAPELEQFEAMGRTDEAFLRFWTLKEAAVKYTGTGLRGYPSDLCFTLTKDGGELADSSLYFATAVRDEHVISICTPKPEPLQLHWLTLPSYDAQPEPVAAGK